MKALLYVIAGLALFMAPPSYAASDAFNRAFEAALRAENDDTDVIPSPTPPFFPRLVSELRQVGTDEDIAAATVLVLRDPAKLEFWSRVMSLAALLRPDFDRTEIINAIRDGWPHIFKLGTPRGVIRSAARLLCSYGTPADIEKLKQYVEEVRRTDPMTVREVEGTMARREDEIRGRKAIQEAQEKAAKQPGETSELPPVSPLKVMSPQGPAELPPAQPVASSHRVTWAVAVVAALGGMLLYWRYLRR